MLYKILHIPSGHFVKVGWGWVYDGGKTDAARKHAVSKRPGGGQVFVDRKAVEHKLSVLNRIFPGEFELKEIKED